MNTMSPNFKLYYILPAVALFIIVLVVLLIPKKTTPNQPSRLPTNSPLPTVVPLVTSQASSKPSASSSLGRMSVSPTLIPAGFTGADVDQHIPQAETDLSVQKNDLRKKTPLTQPNFTITFDYANDLFLVTLKDPKDASKTEFQQWLQANYSNIPLDRFEFK